jgi:hypothetical protein
MVALSSVAQPASAPAAPAQMSTDAMTADAPTETADAAPAASSKPTQVASQPTPALPLTKQTFTVVEAVGVNIALKKPIDVHKPVALKKGQMLVLKSQDGTMIQVDGPFTGKPIDHYKNISDDATMGFDAKSFAPKGHCSGSGAPHPAGGPNPDETGGAELQATHCQ